MVNSIGGYFELELNNGIEYHINALRLNAGRKAFEFVLKTKEISKVYLPYYICNAILEPIIGCNIQYEFYEINDSLMPKINYKKIKNNEVLLFVNYFGLCSSQAQEVVKNTHNVIIDNSQAFFSKPIDDVVTFYSARKFFGVPDGAYLYMDRRDVSIEDLSIDYSYDRMNHLLKRLELEPIEGYENYQINEELFSKTDIRQMSLITQKILKSIDYKTIAQKRRDNFLFLHDNLKSNNKIVFEIGKEDVPMVYPYLVDYHGLREWLIKNKVFIAHYWPGVSNRCLNNSFENKLADRLVCLPVDQRYSHNEMEIIIKLIIAYA